MNTLQHTLMALRVKIHMLLQLTSDDLQQAKQPPASMLARLQRTLEDLETIAATHRQVQLAATRGSARSNGAFSLEVPQPELAKSVDYSTELKIAKQDEKRYQRRLRALLADLLLAEESERRHLAVDLHDGLSQTIALTQIKLAALRRTLNGKQGVACDDIGKLIQEANRTTRSISFELSPLVLHDLGLEPAVEWLVENIQSRYGIEIELALHDEANSKPVDEKTRLILFRAIRELLINAAKHAGAQRIQVRLRHIMGKLSARIEDDGVGMEPEAAATVGSGLFSIQERLAHIGGRMRIRSAPGQGTKISLCAPLTYRDAPKTRLEI